MYDATPSPGAVETISMQPAQPKPVGWQVQSLAFPGGRIATAVTRAWAPGETRACRLCPLCTANHERGTCSVLVDRAVGLDSAAAFSTRGLVPFGAAGADHGDARADRA